MWQNLKYNTTGSITEVALVVSVYNKILMYTNSNRFIKQEEFVTNLFTINKVNKYKNILKIRYMS